MIEDFCAELEKAGAKCEPCVSWLEKGRGVHEVTCNIKAPRPHPCFPQVKAGIVTLKMREEPDEYIWEHLKMISELEKARHLEDQGRVLIRVETDLPILLPQEWHKKTDAEEKLFNYINAKSPEGCYVSELTWLHTHGTCPSKKDTALAHLHVRCLFDNIDKAVKVANSLLDLVAPDKIEKLIGVEQTEDLS